MKAEGHEQVVFKRPLGGKATRHLVVGNCGPSPDPAAISALFSRFDSAPKVTLPTAPGRNLCFVTMSDAAAATAARAALNGTVQTAVPGSGVLAISYAEQRENKRGAAAGQAPESPLVAVRSAEECGIPGLALYPEFVTAEEEAELLAAADAQPHWQLLARRRVMHFGFVFDYESRGERQAQRTHPLPPETQRIAERIQALPQAVVIDQLTVNEYSSGVGISPHVETHSAFTGAIASVSLAGPAVMVLRREGFPQRAVFLPPRSLLVLSGEARYAWQHYIPHRKSDMVAPASGGVGEPEVVPRAERRMSFTFRQVRGFPCDCAFPQHCDSQLAPLAPTRAALKRAALEQAAHQAAQQAGQQELERQREQGTLTPALQQQQAEAGGDAAGLPAAAANVAQEVGGASSPAEQAAGRGSHPSQRACGATAGNLDSGPADASAATVQASLGADMDAQLAALEARYVHSVYNAIAPHFASTRFAVWPRVRAFLESLPPWPVLADVGCGNGKYFGVRGDAFVLGSDRSEGLACVAARRVAPRPCGEGLRADVAVADGMELPYRPASCDGVLCIAVLHHISSPSRRVALLAQLLRVLRPGGRALVTVWATQQENMKKVRSWQPIDAAAAAAAGTPHSSTAAGDSNSANSAACGSVGPAQQQREQHTASARAAGAGAAGSAAPAPPAAGKGAVASGDYFVPWHLPFHRAEAAAAARQASAAGKHQQAQQQAQGTSTAAPGTPPAAAATPAAGAPQLDASKGAVVFQRYYHLFERGELDALVEALPGAAVVDSFYDKDNWCCVFERRAD